MEGLGTGMQDGADPHGCADAGDPRGWRSAGGRGRREAAGKGSKGKALFAGQPGACEGLRAPEFLLHFAPAVCGSRAKVEHGGVERVPEEGRGQGTAVHLALKLPGKAARSFHLPSGLFSHPS